MSRNAFSTYNPNYEVFLRTFTVFTFFDIPLTVVGLSVGCRELNPLVTQWGLQSWVIFRILLLSCLIAIFITGYYLCWQYTSKGVQILEVVLFVLNTFIGAVVFSGLLTIYAQITI